MVNVYIPTNIGTVAVIDSSSNLIIDTYTVPASGYAVAISPDGTKLYLACIGHGVYVISTATGATLATISGVAYTIEGIAVSPDGTLVYVANSGVSSGPPLNSVAVINAATNAIMGTIAVGTTPVAIAFSPDGLTAYVANQQGSPYGNVSVINVATNLVVATLSLSYGSSPACLAVTPNGSELYVVDNGNDTVLVFNTATNVMTYNISTGDRPLGIAITPDGLHVYVTNSGILPSPGSVSVISTATHAPTVAISTNIGKLPCGISITADGSKAYVANANSDNVSAITTSTNTATLISLPVNCNPTAFGQFIQPPAGSPAPAAPPPYAYIANSGAGTVTAVNIATGAIITTITVGTAPNGVAISPDYSRIYVTNYSAGTVSIINPAINKVIATITVGTHPFGIAFSPSGNYVYIANQGSNSLSVINTRSFALTVSNLTTGIGTTPVGVAVSPNSSLVYVTNYGSGTVSVLAAATGNALISTVTVGTNPYGIVISPDGTKAYVANQGSNSVSVINTSTFAVTTFTAGVGNAPTALALNTTGTRLYVTNQTTGTVSVFNTSTNALVTTITIGSSASPYGISFSSDGSKIYVINKGTNTISVINASTNTVSSTISLSSGSNPTSFGQFTQPASIPMTTPYVAPQGRLTLNSSTPVMNADASGVSNVYYVPYQGNIVPIYDGANMQSYAFTSFLTMALSTTAHLSGYIYDLYIYLNGGVVAIGASPAWSGATSRGLGTSTPQQTDGIWVNSAAIVLTNGTSTSSSIPINEATYVGSVYMTAAGQTSMQFKPAAAAGGSNNMLALWNAYNRVRVTSQSLDSTASWTYSSSKVRPADNSNSNRISYLDGLQQSRVEAKYSAFAISNSTSGTAGVALGLNSTNALAGVTGGEAGPSGGGGGGTVTAMDNYLALGFNFVQALEFASNGATAVYYAGGSAQMLQISLEM